MLHNQLANLLYEYSDNPENEFDKVIRANINRIPIMNENQLRMIIMLRYQTSLLCKDIPYTREEILSLIENNEVSLSGPFAQIENNLNTAEFIFDKARGEEL